MPKKQKLLIGQKAWCVAPACPEAPHVVKLFSPWLDADTGEEFFTVYAYGGRWPNPELLHLESPSKYLIPHKTHTKLAARGALERHKLDLVLQALAAS